MTLLLISFSFWASVQPPSEMYVPPQTVVEDSVWHDSKNGQIQPVRITPPDAPGVHHESRWTDNPNAPKTSPAATGNSSWVSGDFQWLGWLAMLGLLGVLVFVLFKVFVNVQWEFTGARRAAVALNSGISSDVHAMQRIDLLPDAIRRSKGNLRDEAQSLAGRGLFDAALVHLYGHQLLLLDRIGWLCLARGKTNRRYAAETRQHQATAANHLNQTIQAFERSYFGKHPIGATQFTSLWQSNLQLEREVANAEKRAT